MKKLLTTFVLFLLCAVLATVCTLGYDAMMEKGIADKVTRLQIIANSDTDADQTLKLAVRDRVLEIAARVTQGCTQPDDARAKLTAALPEIERAASETVYAAGRVYAVHASIAQVEYPFRDYGTFALPSGEYTALRVILGDGVGHNWWCVAFPALCEPTANIEAAATAAGFSQKEIAFIRSDGAKGRFFLLEWLSRLL